MPPSKQLSFPPLVASQKWTIKSEASWPGADYTRRSRLKVTLADAYHPAFMSELEKALGDNFGCFKEALQPQAAEIPRGRPPAEHGVKLIQPSYTLRRKQTQDLQASLGASTQSLSGQVSKSRFLEQTQSAHGPTPSYMWEDREQVVRQAGVRKRGVCSAPSRLRLISARSPADGLHFGMVCQVRQAIA